MAKLVKTDRNGTKYFEDYTCTTCGGTGYIDQYSHIAGGVCFTCDGTGRHKHTWKEYTPEYEAKLEARRIERAIAKSGETNKKFLAKNGFGEDGLGWVVIGNTFQVKDELKANGAKWLNNIGWVLNHEPNNEESCGLSTIKVSIDDITYKNGLGVYQFDNEAYADLIKRIKDAENEEARNSDTTRYIGEVGDKVDTIVELDKVCRYDTDWGTTFIYNFKDEEGNRIVWKTSIYLGFDEDDGTWKKVNEGDMIRIAGKVKECSEYRGMKQTVLTRCKYYKI